MTSNPLLDDLPSPPTPNDIDLLNDRDPLSLSSFDIDSIIAMHRQRRALKATGDYKPSRGSKSESSIDLSQVLARAGLGQPEPTKPVITHGSSLRRGFR